MPVHISLSRPGRLNAKSGRSKRHLQVSLWTGLLELWTKGGAPTPALCLKEVTTMPQAECTQLIRAWQGGDSHARDQLFQMIYPELRQIAARQLRQCNPGNTLNSTALVHELYAKLYNDRAAYESRNHFKAVAAKAMRHIITDHIRRNKAQKRGGDLMQTAMDTSLLAVNNDPHNTVEVLDLLDQLEVLGERFMTVVECRLFAGMTEDEIAQSLSVSRRTIQRDWAKAVAWIQYRMDHNGVPAV